MLESEIPHEQTFEDCYDAQHKLQIESYGSDPVLLEGKEATDFIMWNVVALTDELHEALAEVGWKPWATSRHINRDAYRGELVDAFHFFMNLMMVADITPSELMAEYYKKRQKNADRQAAGYDGVSTKCPGCHRALDDDAVECEQTGVFWASGVVAFRCAVDGKEYTRSINA